MIDATQYLPTSILFQHKKERRMHQNPICGLSTDRSRSSHLCNPHPRLDSIALTLDDSYPKQRGTKRINPSHTIITQWPYSESKPKPIGLRNNIIFNRSISEINRKIRKSQAPSRTGQKQQGYGNTREYDFRQNIPRGKIRSDKSKTKLV